MSGIYWRYLGTCEIEPRLRKQFDWKRRVRGYDNTTQSCGQGVRALSVYITTLRCGS